MSNLDIEGLKIFAPRKDTLSPEAMRAQISAVKCLVTAMHDQLVTHQIDRDAQFGGPKEGHRFDAFFRIPEEEVVIKITSVGLPSEVSENGHFLYLHTKDEQYELDELVGLQTAKVPEAVGEEAALWLSGYLPEELNMLATIVKNAVPIERAAYELYMGQRKSPPHLDSEIDRLAL